MDGNRVFSGGGGEFQLTLFQWVWYLVINYFRGGWWKATQQTESRGGAWRLFWHVL